MCFNHGVGARARAWGTLCGGSPLESVFDSNGMGTVGPVLNGQQGTLHGWWRCPERESQDDDYGMSNAYCSGMIITHWDGPIGFCLLIHVYAESKTVSWGGGRVVV